MTVSRRILWQFAIAAGLVIVVSSAVTYKLVFDAAAKRNLDVLRTYVTERARREEAEFRNIEGNLRLVRGQFEKRMEAAIPPFMNDRWEGRFRLFPDGAWRSREEFSDGRRYSTLWMHKDATLTAQLQVQIVRAQDICDELIRGWVDSFPSVYFVFKGPANIGFDARIANWVWDTPADYDATGLEWYQLALPKEVLTSDALSWTGVQEEPTSREPMVSVYLPIVVKGEFLGSVGHDIWVRRLFDQTSRSELQGATHLILRTDGRLIAVPGLQDKILASKGWLKAEEAGDPVLASLFSTANKPGASTSFEGYDKTGDVFYSVARLKGPEWYYITTMPRSLLQRQAFRSAQWVLWAGISSLALVLAIFALILRRQITKPLAELDRATRQMSSGDTAARAIIPRSDEFGVVASVLNEMAERVAARDADLRHLNEDLEQRVTTRTEELTEANVRLAEAGEETLRTLAKERELGEMRSRFVSLVSHEFRNPLHVIMSSCDILQRYLDRLPEDDREHHLQGIHDSVRHMGRMIEEVLVLGSAESGGMVFKPEKVNLVALCERLVDGVLSATGNLCPLSFQHSPEVPPVTADQNLLHHILGNVLTNAVKYSEPGAPVLFTLQVENGRAEFHIEDHGRGIPAVDLERLYEPFRRGSNVGSTPGTGLGMVIVKRCVHLHGGTISCTSEEGVGTTFHITIPMVPADESRGE